MLSIRRACAALLLVVGLSGCSSVEMMHAVADDVLKSRVSDLLDISDPDDERHLSETVDRFFNEATPVLATRYAAFFNTQADVLEQKGDALSRNDIATMIGDLRQLLRQSAIEVAPAVASVLVDHTTPERVAHLRKALAEKREEDWEERVEGNPEARREDRIDNLSDNVERFVPNLNVEQVAAITAYVDEDFAADDDARFFLYTERRHEALADFLLTQPDEAAIAAYMVPWMVDGPTLVDPEFAPQAEAWWNGRVDLFWAVVSRMDDKQRAATVRVLREYAADIAELA